MSNHIKKQPNFTEEKNLTITPDLDELFDSNEGKLENLSAEDLAERKLIFEREAIPHMKLLYNYAFRMTGDHMEAEDLLQDTYIRAFRFFHKFELGTNCKAWLFRIMKNCYINQYRKNRKEPGKVDYDDVDNFYDSIRSELVDPNDLEHKVFSNLLDDDVLTALNSLQDDYKTVVILCDLEGLSYEEIAEFLDVPIGTVRSRLHRGRKILEKRLTEYARQRGFNIPSKTGHKT